MRPVAEDERYEVPSRTVGDHAHQLIKAALSATPYVGGPAAEFFAAMVAPPLVRRQQDWMDRIASALQRLEDEGRVDLRALVEDEGFITVLLQASQAALRTHREHKLRMLQEAVAHAAEGGTISTDQELMFVRYVDELTPTHLALVVWVYQNREDVANQKSFDELYRAAVQNGSVRVDRDGFYSCFMDLETRGLLRMSDELAGFSDVYGVRTLHTSEIQEGPMLRVTTWGEAFLNFVSAEEALKQDSVDREGG